MRLIDKMNNEKDARFFSSFLNRKGISNQLDVIGNNDWGSDGYGTVECLLWIRDEDRVNDAMNLLQIFKENPRNPCFNEGTLVAGQEFLPEKPFFSGSLPSQLDIKEVNETASPVGLAPKSSSMGIITRILLLGCCLLFFIGSFLSPSKDANLPAASHLFTSPVEKIFLFDYPYVYELIDKVIKLYGYDALQEPNNLPLEGRQLIQKINKTPYWQGFYAIFLKKGIGSVSESLKATPMFEKIRQGELWRLISPAFLHLDIFHLFFNMLWLIVLGKQIEQHLGKFKYIIFILISGVVSNTGQYLMGGPNFIGFSGILCAMLAFIWMRQRLAPWEGYQLDRTTIIFMLIFILAMAGIQFFSFVLEKSIDVTISPGVANMAHLTGAFIGLVLGSFNFFRWRSV